MSNARARSCYVSLIHHYPVSIVTFRVDNRHINAGLRVTEVLLRGASTGMYSSIELTHGQFVQDMSAPVEKDTLINCCHVRQPASSFLSFLIFFFLPFSFLNDGGRDVSTFGSKGIVLYVRVGVLAFFTRGPHDDVPFPLFFTPDDESSSSPCSRSTLINFDFSDGLIEYQRYFECLEFFFLFLSLSLSRS